MNFIFGFLSFDFSQISSEGLTVAIVGYIIVFSALVVMYYIFNNIKKVINLNIRSKLRRQGKHHQLANEDNLHLPGDVSAAISMALFLHFEQYHDDEDYILTIKRISKRYSPWSSKIYGVMDNTPR